MATRQNYESIVTMISKCKAFANRVIRRLDGIDGKLEGLSRKFDEPSMLFSKMD